MHKTAFAPPDVSDPPFLPPPAIVLDLPTPLSANKIRKIDWVFAKRTKLWAKKADAMVLAQKCRTHDPIKLQKISRFELTITISESACKIDLDNTLKMLIDYLRRIEFIEDDSPKHMRRLVVEWGLAPAGSRVTLVELAA